MFHIRQDENKTITKIVEKYMKLKGIPCGMWIAKQNGKNECKKKLPNVNFICANDTFSIISTKIFKNTELPLRQDMKMACNSFQFISSANQPFLCCKIYMLGNVHISLQMLHGLTLTSWRLNRSAYRPRNKRWDL